MRIEIKMIILFMNKYDSGSNWSREQIEQGSRSRLCRKPAASRGWDRRNVAKRKGHTVTLSRFVISYPPTIPKLTKQINKMQQAVALNTVLGVS